MAQTNKDYLRVEKALHYVAMNFRDQPTLAEIAASVHLSEYHFQRLFTRWAGISPKQFLQYLTVTYARECLLSGKSVLDTSYDSGLSSPARLGELFVRLEALTPGEVRTGGAGLLIGYGYHATSFGDALIAGTPRGICGLQFCDPGTRETMLEELKSRLPAADYQSDPKLAAGFAAQIFNPVDEQNRRQSLSLLVAGTSFQIKVWQALLQLPVGGRVSYQQLACEIGNPNAVRAVGSAVGRNPLAMLIPCHRVIRSDGLLGGYHWGLARKLALQGWESAHNRSLERTCKNYEKGGGHTQRG